MVLTENVVELEGDLRYRDGYRLFEALKHGAQVAFLVHSKRYQAQFQGEVAGAQNWLRVTCGEGKVRCWGWGWCYETCFHLLYDLEHDGFDTQFFRYRKVMSASGNHTVLV